MARISLRRLRRGWYAVGLLSLAAVAFIVADKNSVRLPLIGATEQKADLCPGVLIPAYVPPAELAALARRKATRRIVVVNPANGPGPAPDAGYASAIRALQSIDTRVLGYVATTYGSRPARDVIAEIDRYSTWYGVDGVFLDETSSAATSLPHYRALGEATRDQRGLMVVQNPGVVPHPEYFDTADMIVTFEGPESAYGARARQASRIAGVPPAKIAHLIYAASRDASPPFDPSAGVGYVYATPGLLPNPWGELAASLPAQEAQGAACRDDA